MDIKMPGLDGIAACRQIKAAAPAARIIFVTDYDDEWLRAAALQAGGSGYVIKERLLDLRALLLTDRPDAVDLSPTLAR